MILKIDDNLSLEMINALHAEPIFHLVNANRVHLREWLPWVTRMLTLEHFKEFIISSQQRYTDNCDHAFVIVLNEIVVGRIGVYNIDNQNKVGAIGYWLGEEYVGKNIVTSACKTILNYCFEDLNLNRIEIRCATKNHKSQAVAERLNFVKEGIVRQGEYLHNDYIDIYCFSMLKKEWLNTKS